MKMIPYLILSVIVSGCATTSPAVIRSEDFPRMLQKARQSLATDDLYEARRIVQQILDVEPGHEEAELLMVAIINEEIIQQMESDDEVKVIEEYSTQERADAVKTWMERGRALLEAKQYDYAIRAAEKVFLYDPNHLGASRLVDEIKARARRDGKSEEAVLNRMYQSEAQLRVTSYLARARKSMKAERWGVARFALEKVLLLEPENQEALRLYEEIKTKRGFSHS